MKKSLAVASIVLMAGSLTACGGGDSDTASGPSSYCSLLSSTKDELQVANLTSMSQDTFDKLGGQVNAIAAVAPDAVKDDWATLGDAFASMKTALEASGITLSDLQSVVDTQQLPDGVTTAQLQDLIAKLTAVTSDEDVAAASTAIQESAKTDCDITLDESPESAPPSS